jgi:hypothetical protein
MQVQPGGGRRIGERRVLMEQQDQVGPLPEVRRRRASAGESPGLGEELLREGRAMDRRRAGHERTPPAMDRIEFSASLPSIVAALEGLEPYRYL